MSFEAPPTDAASARAKITDPRPAVAAFMTTEHFVLQGARGSTIAESTGRAGMFLATVSGGLVALGLVATASSVGTAFYAFGLVLSRRSPSSGSSRSSGCACRGSPTIAGRDSAPSPG
jgi:hypothetical protein